MAPSRWEGGQGSAPSLRPALLDPLFQLVFVGVFDTGLQHVRIRVFYGDAWIRQGGERQTAGRGAINLANQVATRVTGEPELAFAA